MGSSMQLERVESFESSGTKRIRKQHGDGRFLCETGLLSGVRLGETNEEMDERTRNSERNVFAHRSRNANCYFVIPCKFNFVELVEKASSLS